MSEKERDECAYKTACKRNPSIFIDMPEIMGVAVSLEVICFSGQRKKPQLLEKTLPTRLRVFSKIDESSRREKKQEIYQEYHRKPRSDTVAEGLWRMCKGVGENKLSR